MGYVSPTRSGIPDVILSLLQPELVLSVSNVVLLVVGFVPQEPQSVEISVVIVTPLLGVHLYRVALAAWPKINSDTNEKINNLKFLFRMRSRVYLFEDTGFPHNILKSVFPVFIYKVLYHVYSCLTYIFRNNLSLTVPIPSSFIPVILLRSRGNISILRKR